MGISGQTGKDHTYCLIRSLRGRKSAKREESHISHTSGMRANLIGSGSWTAGPSGLVLKMQTAIA